MLGDAHDAEDAVQDAWVRVHGALPRFLPGAPFDPWFFRILGNRCRTALAARARRHAVVAPGELPEHPVPPATPDDFSPLVHRALAQLPAEQREAFLLRHVEDLDYEAIAEATGVGLSAVRMRVKRACDQLRTLLAPEVTDG
jgi:RNA polymerase sigma-70 factor (ECF subfamily)